MQTPLRLAICCRGDGSSNIRHEPKGAAKKERTNRRRRWRIVRPGWFQGSRCCPLLSLSVKLHRDQATAIPHTRVASAAPCVSVPARSHKRGWMPVSGLLSHAVHAATVSQAGILMSSFFSDQNGRMLNSAIKNNSDSKAAGWRIKEGRWGKG